MFRRLLQHLYGLTSSILARIKAIVTPMNPKKAETLTSATEAYAITKSI
jgi:hypothetical protein